MKRTKVFPKKYTFTVFVQGNFASYLAILDFSTSYKNEKEKYFVRKGKYKKNKFKNF